MAGQQEAEGRGEAAQGQGTEAGPAPEVTGTHLAHPGGGRRGPALPAQAPIRHEEVSTTCSQRKSVASML